MAQARVDKRLVDWRLRDRGITHKQAASFLGVQPPQFSRRLSGDRNMSDAHLDRLCLLLGMDVSLIELEVAA